MKHTDACYCGLNLALYELLTGDSLRAVQAIQLALHRAEGNPHVRPHTLLPTITHSGFAACIFCRTCDCSTLKGRQCQLAQHIHIACAMLESCELQVVGLGPPCNPWEEPVMYAM